MSLVPAIADLPTHVFANDWNWVPAKPDRQRPFPLQTGWWIGIDGIGQKWLFKMSGANCAYREHVFAALAQRIGISCQSSLYVTIPRNAPPVRDMPLPERHQLALWFFDEHLPDGCSLSHSCPLLALRNLKLESDATLETYLSCGVSDAIDLIRGEILGYLCGQFEPAGRLFTVRHEFVQIDNELMFATGPVNLMDCRWLRFHAGRQCAKDVCLRLSEISDEELLSLAAIPTGYVVRRKNFISRRLLAARQAARNFMAR